MTKQLFLLSIKVIPHKFRMDEQAYYSGRVINKKYGFRVCIDHLQRDNG